MTARAERALKPGLAHPILLDIFDSGGSIGSGSRPGSRSARFGD